MGRSRYKVLDESHTYFVTSAVVNWLPLFNQPPLADIVLRAMQFLHDRGQLTIHAYVLLEDHFHLVGSSAEFSQALMSLKSFTAKRIVESLTGHKMEAFLRQLQFVKKRHKKDQLYQVWQEGFHPEAILDEAMLRQKIEYVHGNPVRRGYVDEGPHWRYSSARDYVGGRGLVTVEPLL